MKDFDDFGGLSEGDAANALNSVIDEMGLDSDDSGLRVPIASIPEFCTRLSSMTSLLMLRRYHEWANS